MLGCKGLKPFYSLDLDNGRAFPHCLSFIAYSFRSKNEVISSLMIIFHFSLLFCLKMYGCCEEKFMLSHSLV